MTHLNSDAVVVMLKISWKYKVTNGNVLRNIKQYRVCILQTTLLGRNWEMLATF